LPPLFVMSLDSGCRKRPQIWSVAANTLNGQSQVVDKGWSPTLGSGRWMNRHSPKKQFCYDVQACNGETEEYIVSCFNDTDTNIQPLFTMLSSTSRSSAKNYFHLATYFHYASQQTEYHITLVLICPCIVLLSVSVKWLVIAFKREAVTTS